MMSSATNLLYSNRIELLIGINFFLILFNNQLSALFVSILVLAILFERQQLNFRFSTNAILTITFFIYLILREVFDVNPKKGFDFIIRLSPILLLSLTLAFYRFKNRQVQFLSKFLMLIHYLFFASALLYGLSTYLIDFNKGITQDFSYYQWLVPIKFKFHPPYWGLFITLSLIVVIMNKEIKNVNKYVFIGTSVLFLILLSSRVAFFSALLIFLIHLTFKASIRKVNKVILIISILIISFSSILFSPYLSKKIKSNEGFVKRELLWTSSFEAIKDHKLFGHSFSQTQIAIKKYNDRQHAKNTNYDPHNQFIFFAVSIGMIGLALFLLTLFCHQYYHLGSYLFLIVIVLSFMTESVINRQMGVIMYALFLNLIFNKSFTLALSNKL